MGCPSLLFFPTGLLSPISSLLLTSHLGYHRQWTFLAGLGSIPRLDSPADLLRAPANTYLHGMQGTFNHQLSSAYACLVALYLQYCTSKSSRLRPTQTESLVIRVYTVHAIVDLPRQVIIAIIGSGKCTCSQSVTRYARVYPMSAREDSRY